MLPALYPFESRDQWISFADQFLASTDSEKTVVNRLVERGLIPIIKGPEIAILLGISPKLVSHMAKFPGKYYRTFRIPKKKGAFREITAPRVFLKTVQRYILDCVLSQVPINNASFGFKRGCNCKSGATLHVGKKFLWNIDIKNFFPSISNATVQTMFVNLGYPAASASFMTGLCCLDGKLPQGAPTSPAISNIVFASLDEAFVNLSKSNRITYSRYADDLSFSCDTPVPEGFRLEVIELLNKSGFAIQEGKSRLIGPATRREVTGLTINTQVSIPRTRRRELRAFFHHVEMNPSAYVEERSKAIGLAAWIHSYHPGEAKIYFEIAHSIPVPRNE